MYADTFIERTKVERYKAAFGGADKEQQVHRLDNTLSPGVDLQQVSRRKLNSLKPWKLFDNMRLSTHVNRVHNSGRELFIYLFI